MWGETKLLEERRANDIRAYTVGVFQAGVAIMSGKPKDLNKWLKDLG